jgi:Fic family protein
MTTLPHLQPDDRALLAPYRSALAGSAYDAGDVDARSDLRARLEGGPLPRAIGPAWDALRHRRTPAPSLAFTASAVYSSNIEGNPVSLSDLLRSRQRARSATPRKKEIEEIEALEAVYAWAAEHVPSEANLLEAHRRFAAPLLGKRRAGRYRTTPVAVWSASGLVYAAADPEDVPALMGAFFDALTRLRRAAQVSVSEAFYHAALAHLVFAKIHPFEDGNGRAGRLVEKWLLAALLGRSAWRLPSESFYWHHRPLYYEALRVVGPDFDFLDYRRGVPFLTLLPRALTFNADLP